MTAACDIAAILGPETERAIAELERGRLERAKLNADRAWAALMLARTRQVASSILRGLPVRVGNLDPFVLNRALRGQPHLEAYIVVTEEMLDAVAEAGPIELPVVRSRQEVTSRVA